MNIVREIEALAQAYNMEMKQKNNVWRMKLTVAERKMFLFKNKLVYKAKIKLNEDDRQLLFSESLTEIGIGVSSGVDTDIPGMSFRTEKTKIHSSGERDSHIVQQADLFGKKYNFDFNFGEFRKKIEHIAHSEGLQFRYKIF